LPKQRGTVTRQTPQAQESGVRRQHSGNSYNRLAGPCAQRLSAKWGGIRIGRVVLPGFLRDSVLIIACISHTAHNANANANANGIVVHPDPALCAVEGKYNDHGPRHFTLHA
jgi:hypothetical protein